VCDSLPVTWWEWALLVVVVLVLLVIAFAVVQRRRRTGGVVVSPAGARTEEPDTATTGDPRPGRSAGPGGVR